MNKKLFKNLQLFLVFLCAAVSLPVGAQYWQQRVDYSMNIDLNTKNHRFSGDQKLTYTNNSKKEISEVYYHLYYNAFQPGSEMDVRSRTIKDPDPRISDRISNLNESEIGYQKILTLKQDGAPVSFTVNGTVVRVKLNKPVAPGKKTVLEMTFEAQVPVMIRRTGRMNSEGIEYTMTQWYPKLAVFDKHGWNADPYIGREFYGDFGSFDVSITLPAAYTVAGTGVLVNAKEIGHGYSDAKPENDRLTWRFKAENVHDFAWAADRDYLHTTAQVPNGPVLRFFYQNDTTITDNWQRLRDKMVKCFVLMEEKFGKYPYPVFSFIQAGDGGMEYPMCTMVSGTGSFGSLVSVCTHEAIHNWYYGALGTNELKYPWMDEGFTTFAQDIILDSLFNKRSLNPLKRRYESYIRYVQKNVEEPMTTHADHFSTNAGYGIAAYSKGAVFLNQLRYIVGDDAFYAGMKDFFETWKFKHPEPDDFKAVMENHSKGIDLDWYFDGWLKTTKQIDYAIREVKPDGGGSRIIIERIGELDMPLEVLVTTKSGKSMVYAIPVAAQQGNMPNPYPPSIQWIMLKPWQWAYSFYEIKLPIAYGDIDKIVIDPREMLADVHRTENNYYPFEYIGIQSGN
ncbi:MAG: M1 family metallopeptidase [Salibacteraceae bacterium]